MALATMPALAGITVTGSNGIAATGVDGVSYVGTSGIAATGVDGRLAFAPNGIMATGVDGIAATGVDGSTYAGTNGITATGVDGASFDSANGIMATGVDGITLTTLDGTVYQVDSFVVHEANGIMATGVDAITATGVDGITATGVDSFAIGHADAITATGVDGFGFSGASGITATGVDGHVFSVAPNGITATGVDAITATGVDGIAATGVDAITATGVDGITATGVDDRPGLQSVDPELALAIEEMADDRSVNAVVVYHRLPTDADVADLTALGVVAGTRYRALPMIALTCTRGQLVSISHLSAVRSIYGVRTLDSTGDDTSRTDTGVDRTWRDADLAAATGGAGPTGRNVTVAVLDTGVDATHQDLAGRVVHNLELVDAQGLGVGFQPPPAPIEMANTDHLHGHGTFVAGVVAGSGAASSGRHMGVAPGARILGLSAGDLTLLHVLAGFDYLLEHGAESNVRVVNCSFSAATVFDVNDPVNVATRMLVERGVTVVVSAGNTGPGWNTMNPYAVAPWVIGVGATDGPRRLADYSSRGDFNSGLFRPKLVAPGTHVTGLRTASAPSLTGVLGVETDTRRFTAAEMPYYTSASGTSFSAPQVAGVVALMLEANPALTPAAILDILQRTATPMPRYYQHEVGAGMLNAHAAVLEAAFPSRRMGEFRGTLDHGQVRFVKETRELSGSVEPHQGLDVAVPVPANTIQLSVQVAWGPLLTLNDLDLELVDGSGVRRATSSALNLPGLTGRRESITLGEPAAGTWRARISHKTSVVATTQQATGFAELSRVEYAPIGDLAGLPALTQNEIRRAIRSFVMAPVGSKFHPTWTVSRGELAATMVRAGRAPQYLAAEPVFTDVRDRATRLAVESARGLFPTVTGSFAPHADVTRLVAAVVLVRAAGLASEAEARANDPLVGLLDGASIPAAYRGYVAVAIDRGLLTLSGGRILPSATITRAELAHATAVLLAQ